MLGHIIGWCHDCEADRVLLVIEGPECCCTTCDAAVFLLDGLGASTLHERRRAG